MRILLGRFADTSKQSIVLGADPNVFEWMFVSSVLIWVWNTSRNANVVAFIASGIRNFYRLITSENFGCLEQLTKIEQVSEIIRFDVRKCALLLR